MRRILMHPSMISCPDTLPVGWLLWVHGHLHVSCIAGDYKVVGAQDLGRLLTLLLAGGQHCHLAAHGLRDFHRLQKSGNTTESGEIIVMGRIPRTVAQDELSV